MKEAAVGDSLELHFTILDPDSPYEIFVRELIAKDGNDQNEIVLLDSIGCPTEGRILGPLGRETGAPKSLMARFDAFKFPTSETVQFRALVTPCMPRCKPVECVYEDYRNGDKTRVNSYGRRRRETMTMAENPLSRWLGNFRSGRSLQQSTLGDDVLVTHAFTITDKFEQNVKEKNTLARTTTQVVDVKKPIEKYFNEDSLSFAPEETKRPGTFDADGMEICLDLTGLIVGVGVFLVVQLLLVFVWTHFWQTRQKKKRSLPYSR